MVLLELFLYSQRKKLKKFGKQFGIDFDKLRPTEEEKKEIEKRFRRV